MSEDQSDLFEILESAIDAACVLALEAGLSEQEILLLLKKHVAEYEENDVTQPPIEESKP